jgi:hypothetical protein
MRVVLLDMIGGMTKTKNQRKNQKKENQIQNFPFQNGFVSAHTKTFPPNKMRNPLNALTETVESLGLTTSVQEYAHLLRPRTWHLKILSLPTANTESHLIIEVIEEEDGDASVCVLQRKNVGRRVMNRILNRLCEKLNDENLIYAQPSPPPPSRAETPSPQQ